ncbi:uncharacterized protein LOC110859443 isoform X2 [Folsomia candida]|uniref:uncharacterized protein LOC110859443 isoform X2 n=1 Tax=Folsomia candida TaxID=158441 RepID=UPI001604DC75|nr:uncharacterized protein LOC110859443 isoform X2 [Folsomia candida]
MNLYQRGYAFFSLMIIMSVLQYVHCHPKKTTSEKTDQRNLPVLYLSQSDGDKCVELIPGKPTQPFSVRYSIFKDFELTLISDNPVVVKAISINPEQCLQAPLDIQDSSYFTTKKTANDTHYFYQEIHVTLDLNSDHLFLVCPRGNVRTTRMGYFEYCIHIYSKSCLHKDINRSSMVYEYESTSEEDEVDERCSGQRDLNAVGEVVAEFLDDNVIKNLTQKLDDCVGLRDAINGKERNATLPILYYNYRQGIEDFMFYANQGYTRVNRLQYENTVSIILDESAFILMKKCDNTSTTLNQPYCYKNFSQHWGKETFPLSNSGGGSFAFTNGEYGFVVRPYYFRNGSWKPEFGDAKKSDNSVRVIENSIRQEGNTMTFWLKHDPWVYGLYFNPIAKCIGELKVQDVISSKVTDPISHDVTTETIIRFAGDRGTGGVRMECELIVYSYFEDVVTKRVIFKMKPVPQVKLEGYDADSDGVVYIDYVKGQEFSPVTGSVIGDLDAEVFLRREDGNDTTVETVDGKFQLNLTAPITSFNLSAGGDGGLSNLVMVRSRESTVELESQIAWLGWGLIVIVIVIMLSGLVLIWYCWSEGITPCKLYRKVRFYLS